MTSEKVRPRVALIACGATKAPVTCAARELYRGQLFRASLRWALPHCDRVYVLSAKHGLLDLDAQVEPYDETLPRDRAGREAWGSRVGAQIVAAVGEIDTTLVVLAAAAELRRLSGLDTGHHAAVARAAWSRHLKTCEPCRAWSMVQERAPRGTIAVAAEECPEEQRLTAAANAAEKVHAEAQEKRAALPLVLVAWIEGLA